MRAKSWKKIQVKTSSHNLDPPEGGSRIPLAAQLRDVEENVLQKDEQVAPRGPEGPCPPAHFLVRVSPEGTWGVTAPPPCTCSSPGVPAGLSLSLPAPFPLSPCHPALREGLGGRASSQAEGKKWRFQARRTGERRRAAAGNRQGARGAGARRGATRVVAPGVDASEPGRAALDAERSLQNPTGHGRPATSFCRALACSPTEGARRSDNSPTAACLENPEDAHSPRRPR